VSCRNENLAPPLFVGDASILNSCTWSITEQGATTKCSIILANGAFWVSGDLGRRVGSGDQSFSRKIYGLIPDTPYTVTVILKKDGEVTSGDYLKVYLGNCDGYLDVTIKKGSKKVGKAVVTSDSNGELDYAVSSTTPGYYVSSVSAECVNKSSFAIVDDTPSSSSSTFSSSSSVASSSSSSTMLVEPEESTSSSSSSSSSLLSVSLSGESISGSSSSSSSFSFVFDTDPDPISSSSSSMTEVAPISSTPSTQSESSVSSTSSISSFTAEVSSGPTETPVGAKEIYAFHEQTVVVLSDNTIWGMGNNYGNPFLQEKQNIYTQEGTVIIPQYYGALYASATKFTHEYLGDFSNVRDIHIANDSYDAVDASVEGISYSVSYANTTSILDISGRVWTWGRDVINNDSIRQPTSLTVRSTNQYGQVSTIGYDSDFLERNDVLRNYVLGRSGQDETEPTPVEENNSTVWGDVIGRAHDALFVFNNADRILYYGGKADSNRLGIGIKSKELGVSRSTDKYDIEIESAYTLSSDKTYIHLKDGTVKVSDPIFTDYREYLLDDEYGFSDVPISGVSNMSSTSDSVAVFVKSDGKVFYHGDDARNLYGNSDSSIDIPDEVVKYAEVDGVDTFHYGDGRLFISKSSGELLAWGNIDGYDDQIPTLVEGISGIKHFASDSHGKLIFADSDGVLYGKSDYDSNFIVPPSTRNYQNSSTSVMHKLENIKRDTSLSSISASDNGFFKSLIRDIYGNYYVSNAYRPDRGSLGSSNSDYTEYTTDGFSQIQYSNILEEHGGLKDIIAGHLIFNDGTVRYQYWDPTETYSPNFFNTDETPYVYPKVNIPPVSVFHKSYSNSSRNAAVFIGTDGNVYRYGLMNSLTTVESISAQIIYPSSVGEVVDVKIGREPYSTYILKSDGTVHYSPEVGEDFVPYKPSTYFDVKQIGVLDANYNDGVYALKSDGTIPGTLVTGVSELARGPLNMVFLKSDGTVTAPQSRGSAQPPILETELDEPILDVNNNPIDNVKSIYTDTSTTYASSDWIFCVKSDGSIWSAEYRNSSSRNNPLLYIRMAEVDLTGDFWNVTRGEFKIPNIEKLKVEDSTAFIITSDKRVWSWGSNNGILPGALESNVTSPTLLGISGVEDVTSSGTHAIYLKTGGDIEGYGSNNRNQLNFGTDGVNVKNVYARQESSVVLKSDGTVWVCGKNNARNLWMSNSPNVNALQIIPSITNARDIYPYVNSYMFVKILLDDNSLYTTASDYPYLPHKLDEDIDRLFGANQKYAITIDGKIKEYVHSGSYGRDVSIREVYNLGDSADASEIITLRGEEHRLESTLATDDDAIVLYGNTIRRLANLFSSTSLYGTEAVLEDVDAELIIPDTTVNFDNAKKTVSSIDNIYVLDNDGTVWSAGRGTEGQLGATSVGGTIGFIQAISGVEDIYAGGSHVIVKASDGDYYGWGKNDQGQLGIDNLDNQFEPVTVPISGAKLFALGSNHTVMVDNDDSIYAWGSNSRGQLGNGSTLSTSTVTKLGDVYQKSDFIDVVAVGDSTYYRRSNGSIYGVGSNEYGQLSLDEGNRADVYTPKELLAYSTLYGIAQIDSRYSHTLAKASDGTVYAWGYNDSSQLGDFTTSNSDYPKQVRALTTISNIDVFSLGSGHSVYKDTDGNLYGFGSNQLGQLGIDDIDTITGPRDLGQTVDTVATGDNHTVFLESGKVYASGSNARGQIGNGDTELNNVYSFYQLFPEEGSSVLGQSVFAGYDKTCVVDTDGYVWGMGSNSYGELGDGTTIDKLSPTKSEDLGSIEAVAVGKDHVIYKRTDGTAWGRGKNSSGQLGVGDFIDKDTPTQLSTVVSSIDKVICVSEQTLVFQSNNYLWGAGTNVAEADDVSINSTFVLVTNYHSFGTDETTVRDFSPKRAATLTTDSINKQREDEHYLTSSEGRIRLYSGDRDMWKARNAKDAHYIYDSSTHGGYTDNMNRVYVPDGLFYVEEKTSIPDVKFYQDGIVLSGDGTLYRNYDHTTETVSISGEVLFRQDVLKAEYGRYDEFKPPADPVVEYISYLDNSSNFTVVEVVDGVENVIGTVSGVKDFNSLRGTSLLVMNDGTLENYNYSTPNLGGATYDASGSIFATSKLTGVTTATGMSLTNTTNTVVTSGGDIYSWGSSLSLPFDIPSFITEIENPLLVSGITTDPSDFIDFETGTPAPAAGSVDTYARKVVCVDKDSSVAGTFVLASDGRLWYYGGYVTSTTSFVNYGQGNVHLPILVTTYGLVKDIHRGKGHIIIEKFNDPDLYNMYVLRPSSFIINQFPFTIEKIIIKEEDHFVGAATFRDMYQQGGITLDSQGYIWAWGNNEDNQLNPALLTQYSKGRFSNAGQVSYKFGDVGIDGLYEEKNVRGSFLAETNDNVFYNGDGRVKVGIKRTGYNLGEAILNYSFTLETLTDVYVAVKDASLHWDALDSSTKYITFNVHDVGGFDDPKTMTINLEAELSGMDVALDDISVTIQKQLPQVVFSRPFFLGEEGKIIDIDVELSASDAMSGFFPVSVDYEVTSGTGVALSASNVPLSGAFAISGYPSISGSDAYATTLTGTLIWNNINDITTKSFNLSILEDYLIEEQEDINLKLKTPVNCYIGTQETSKVLIQTQNPYVGFESESYEFAEGTYAELPVLFVNSLPSLSSGPTISGGVEYLIQGGTAVSGSNGISGDYGEQSFQSSGILTWNTEDDVNSISIPIHEDYELEYGESFTVTLLNPTNVELGARNTVTINIPRKQEEVLDSTNLTPSEYLLNAKSKLFTSALNNAYVGTDGLVYIWGSNIRGLITENAYDSGIEVRDGLTDIKELTGWDNQMFALQSNGKVLSWGLQQSHFPLGDATVPSGQTRSTPTVVSVLDSIKSISFAFDHGAALASDGVLYSWGENSNGQAGVGSRTDISTPTIQSNLLQGNVSAIEASDTVSMALLSDGRVFVMGQSSDGQTGTNYGNSVTSTNLNPRQLGIPQVTSIALGDTTGFAGRSDASLYGWGNPTKGELGRGDTLQRNTPVVLYATPTGRVFSGSRHCMSVYNNRARVVGHNDKGQLGLGTQGEEFNTNAFKFLNTLLPIDNIKQVSAGNKHSLALSSDGTVWSWGDNDYGQLGRHQYLYPEEHGVPKKLFNYDELDNVRAIGGVGDISLVIKSDNEIWCAGNKRYASSKEYSIVPPDLDVDREIFQPTGQYTDGDVLVLNSYQNENEFFIIDDNASSMYQWGTNPYQKLIQTGAVETPVLSNLSYPIKETVSLPLYLITRYEIFPGASGYRVTGNSDTRRSKLVQDLQSVIGDVKEIGAARVRDRSGASVHILFENGKIRWAGYNNYGHWGTNSTSSSVSDFSYKKDDMDDTVLVEDAVSVASTTTNSLYVSSDGDVYMAGFNNGASDPLFKKITNPYMFSNYTKVYATNHVRYLLLNESNTLFHFISSDGDNGYIPVAVTGNVKDVKCSLYDGSFMVLHFDGTVSVWGQDLSGNSIGRLGANQQTATELRALGQPSPISPLQPGELQNISEVTANEGFSYALESSGILYGTGRGDPRMNSVGTTSIATVVNGAVTSLWSSHETTVASSYGINYIWGNLEQGQRGVGLPEGYENSQRVFFQFEKLAISEKHMSYIDSDGNVYSWGNNNFGQVGIGSSYYSVSMGVPVGMSLTPPEVVDGVLMQPYGPIQSGEYYPQLAYNYNKTNDLVITDKLRSGYDNLYIFSSNDTIWSLGDTNYYQSLGKTGELNYDDYYKEYPKPINEVYISDGYLGLELKRREYGDLPPSYDNGNFPISDILVEEEFLYVISEEGRVYCKGRSNRYGQMGDDEIDKDQLQRVFSTEEIRISDIVVRQSNSTPEMDLENNLNGSLVHWSTTPQQYNDALSILYPYSNDPLSDVDFSGDIQTNYTISQGTFVYPDTTRIADIRYLVNYSGSRVIVGASYKTRQNDSVVEYPVLTGDGETFVKKNIYTRNDENFFFVDNEEVFGTIDITITNANGQGTYLRNIYDLKFYERTGSETVFVDGDAGEFHSLFRADDGKVFSIGNDRFGQLGTDGGTPTDGVHYLTEVSGVSNAKKAVVGKFAQSYALTSSGDVYSWGYNYGGELGVGDNKDKYVPTMIESLSGSVADIAASHRALFVLKSDGSLLATGTFEIPDGESVLYGYSPSEIATGVNGVFADKDHVFYSKDDGSLWGFGNNSYGELSNGTTVSQATPVMLPISGANLVSFADNTVYVAKTDGTVWSWGRDSNGKLGVPYRYKESRDRLFENMITVPSNRTTGIGYTEEPMQIKTVWEDDYYDNGWRRWGDEIVLDQTNAKGKNVLEKDYKLITYNNLFLARSGLPVPQNITNPKTVELINDIYEEALVEGITIPSEDDTFVILTEEHIDLTEESAEDLEDRVNDWFEDERLDEITFETVSENAIDINSRRSGIEQFLTDEFNANYGIQAAPVPWQGGTYTALSELTDGLKVWEVTCNIWNQIGDVLNLASPVPLQKTEWTIGGQTGYPYPVALGLATFADNSSDEDFNVHHADRPEFHCPTAWEMNPSKEAYAYGLENNFHFQWLYYQYLKTGATCANGFPWCYPYDHPYGPDDTTRRSFPKWFGDPANYLFRYELIRKTGPESFLPRNMGGKEVIAPLYNGGPEVDLSGWDYIGGSCPPMDPTIPHDSYETEPTRHPISNRYITSEIPNNLAKIYYYNSNNPEEETIVQYDGLPPTPPHTYTSGAVYDNIALMDYSSGEKIDITNIAKLKQGYTYESYSSESGSEINGILYPQFSALFGLLWEFALYGQHSSQDRLLFAAPNSWFSGGVPGHEENLWGYDSGFRAEDIWVYNRPDHTLRYRDKIRYKPSGGEWEDYLIDVTIELPSSIL
jgi:alpha-tubulin suppressor-like RCC1 family protein